MTKRTLLEEIDYHLSDLRGSCWCEDGLSSSHTDMVCAADNALSQFKNKLNSLTCDDQKLKEGFELAKKMILNLSN